MKFFDGVFTTEWHYQEHDGQMTRVFDQPSKNLILERNKQLRLNPGALQDLGAQSGGTFGRQIASIPEIVFMEAIHNGYDLLNKDRDIATRELNRFLRTDIGRACMVVE